MGLTYFGFLIGAINTIVLYQRFMSPDYYGLINVLLSAAMIFYPFFVFGMGSGIIRFYPINSLNNQKGEFVFMVLLLPLISIALFGIVFFVSENLVNDLLSEKSALLKPYYMYIYFFGVFFGLFDLLYSLSKVQLKTVYGNFLKEIFVRISVSLLLVLLHFDYITEHEFIQYLLLFYGIRVMLMGYYSLRPIILEIKIKFPNNRRDIINYSLFVVFSVSVLYFLYEIDKVMVSQMIDLNNVAYYAVATFIGITVVVPGRSMQQILVPLIATSIANKEFDKVEDLYKKSSINMLIVTGMVFLLIVLNTGDLFYFFDDKFKGGENVVFYVALAKLITMMFGSGNAIITNSKYYRFDLLFGLMLVFITVGLNLMLIPTYGIDGAAMATALTVTVYGFLRMAFVWFLFKVHPFSKKTPISLLAILTVYLFVDNLAFTDNAIFNIIVRSLLIIILFGLFIIVYKPSDEVENIRKQLVDKFRK